MPQIVPVSDFRANIKSVAEHTDRGEVVVLTQNGHPRWAMIDYDEWNEAARAAEMSFARAIRETEARDAEGTLDRLSADEARERIEARKAARRGNPGGAS